MGLKAGEKLLCEDVYYSRTLPTRVVDYLRTTLSSLLVEIRSIGPDQIHQAVIAVAFGRVVKVIIDMMVRFLRVAITIKRSYKALMVTESINSVSINMISSIIIVTATIYCWETLLNLLLFRMLAAEWLAALYIK